MDTKINTMPWGEENPDSNCIITSEKTKIKTQFLKTHTLAGTLYKKKIFVSVVKQEFSFLILPLLVGKKFRKTEKNFQNFFQGTFVLVN